MKGMSEENERKREGREGKMEWRRNGEKEEEFIISL